ncbi:DUF445 domain-containing protein [Leucobacter sp. HY1908]
MLRFRPRSTLGARTPDDFARLEGLRRMQAIALALLGFMAVVFVVSFLLQSTHPAWGFVRAASEGGMVGALADWFAVTALFRHPLGIKIPHTNLISRKKDEIGEGLGSFIEDNFLAEDVVHDKLAEISGARAAGAWLTGPNGARRTSDLVAAATLGALDVLDDNDVRAFVETHVRTHILDPEWGPLMGRALDSFVAGEHEETLIDVAAGRLAEWLETHPHAFDRVLSAQLPSWLPNALDRFIDQRLHSEAVRFARAVATTPDHPARQAIRRFLRDLGRDLQEQDQLRTQLESFKHEVFDSPRIRSLAASTWDTARAAIVEMLSDPASELRCRMTAAAEDFGRRLQGDATLQYKIDVWVMGVVEHLVQEYRHDLAKVVTETVQRWDAHEAAEKIELQVGRDLQFIRINGTVVGALAGLAIYTVAALVLAPLAS